MARSAGRSWPHGGSCGVARSPRAVWTPSLRRRGLVRMMASYMRSPADDRPRPVASAPGRARLGGRRDLRAHPELRRDHHPADHRDPAGPAAARYQAGQVDAAHADRAAEDQAGAAEVQGQQAASTGRDHEALQGVRGQPVLRVLARAVAVPHPHRHVLGAALAAAPDPRPDRQRPVRRRVPADPRDDLHGRAERAADRRLRRRSRTLDPSPGSRPRAPRSWA